MDISDMKQMFRCGERILVSCSGSGDQVSLCFSTSSQGHPTPIPVFAHALLDVWGTLFPQEWR